MIPVDDSDYARLTSPIDQNHLIWRRLERIENILNKASENIARLEAQLMRVNDLQADHKVIHDEIHDVQREINAVAKTVNNNKLVVDAVKYIGSAVAASCIALLFTLYKANGGS